MPGTARRYSNYPATGDPRRTLADTTVRLIRQDASVAAAPPITDKEEAVVGLRPRTDHGGIGGAQRRPVLPPREPRRPGWPCAVNRSTQRRTACSRPHGPPRRYG